MGKFATDGNDGNITQKQQLQNDLLVADDSEAYSEELRQASTAGGSRNGRTHANIDNLTKTHRNSKPVRTDNKQSKAHATMEATLRAADGLTILCTMDGNIHAVNAKDPDMGVLWQTALGPPTINSYQRDDTTETGRIIPGEDGALYIWNPRAGLADEVQRFDHTVPDVVAMTPIHQMPMAGRLDSSNSAGQYIVGSKSTNIFRIDVLSGSVVANFSTHNNMYADPKCEPQKPEMGFALDTGGDKYEEQESLPASSFESDDVDDEDFLSGDGGEGIPVTNAKNESSQSYVSIARHDFVVRAYDPVSHNELWNITYSKFSLPGTSLMSNKGYIGDGSSGRAHQGVDSAVPPWRSVDRAEDIVKAGLEFGGIRVVAAFGAVVNKACPSGGCLALDSLAPDLPGIGYNGHVGSGVMHVKSLIRPDGSEQLFASDHEVLVGLQRGLPVGPNISRGVVVANGKNARGTSSVSPVRSPTLEVTFEDGSTSADEFGTGHEYVDASVSHQQPQASSSVDTSTSVSRVETSSSSSSTSPSTSSPSKQQSNSEGYGVLLPTLSCLPAEVDALTSASSESLTCLAGQAFRVTNAHAPEQQSNANVGGHSSSNSGALVVTPGGDTIDGMDGLDGTSPRTPLILRNLDLGVTEEHDNSGSSGGGGGLTDIVWDNTVFTVPLVLLVFLLTILGVRRRLHSGTQQQQQQQQQHQKQQQQDSNTSDANILREELHKVLGGNEEDSCITIASTEPLVVTDDTSNNNNNNDNNNNNTDSRQDGHDHDQDDQHQWRPVVMSSKNEQQVGELRIFTDRIKGRGCNGTTVFEGKFGNSRPVAVKRMLKTFFGTGKKEIDLLIRLDGHPNIVRYFAKEEGPDFVYLALELCTKTLDAALSEYVTALHHHNHRRGKHHHGGHPVDPLTAMVSHSAAFDSAVRFVRDIAEAVRYLHASRIVHLDIKPQNILVVPRESSGGASPIVQDGRSKINAPKSPILRPRSTGPTASNTDPHLPHERDTVVLGFGDMWMPKISDMGLGKHVGDNTSSFMLSPASVMGLARGGARTGAAEEPSHLSMASSLASQSSSMNSSVNTASIVGLGTVGWRAPELLNAPLQQLAGIAHDKVLEDTDPKESDDTDDDDDDEEGDGQDPRLSRKVDVFSVGCIIQYVLTHGGHPFGEVLHEREQRIMFDNPVGLARLKHMPELCALVREMVSVQASQRPSMDRVVSHPGLWSTAAKAKFLAELSDRIDSADVTSNQLMLELESSAAGVIGKDKDGWLLRLHPLLQKDTKENRFRKYNYASVGDLLRVLRNKRSHVRELDTDLRNLLSPLPHGLMHQFCGVGKFNGLTKVCYDFVLRTLAHEREFTAVLGDVVAQKHAGKSREWAEAARERAHTGAWLLTKVQWAHQDAAMNAVLAKRNATCAPSFNHKTSLCQNWEESRGTKCFMGKRCAFAHGLFELRTMPRVGEPGYVPPAPPGFEHLSPMKSGNSPGSGSGRSRGRQGGGGGGGGGRRSRAGGLGRNRGRGNGNNNGNNNSGNGGGGGGGGGRRIPQPP